MTTIDGTLVSVAGGRTTIAAVSGIIEVDSSISLVPFIVLANALVTEVCTGTAGPTPAYDDERLELIERWLVAHLYTVRDPRVTSEKAGSVSANYQSRVGLGFDSSHYGQMAMRLDTNGGLANLNELTKKGSPRVGVLWPGTPANEVDQMTSWS